MQPRESGRSRSSTACVGEIRPSFSGDRSEPQGCVLGPLPGSLQERRSFSSLSGKTSLVRMRGIAGVGQEEVVLYHVVHHHVGVLRQCKARISRARASGEQLEIAEKQETLSQQLLRSGTGGERWAPGQHSRQAVALFSTQT